MSRPTKRQKLSIENPAKKVTVGIDFGSTSTRMFLKDHPVENKDRLNNMLGQYEFSDFSSTCYPFDGGKVYCDELFDSSRESASLAHGLYVLAHASDKIEGYPLAKPLLARRHDSNVHDRLRAGLDEHLLRLKGRLDAVCRARRFTVANVAFCATATWTTNMETIFHDLIVKVFAVPEASVQCLRQTDALTFYLLRGYFKELQGVDPPEPATPSRSDLGFAKSEDVMLLLLDFGGHSMNGCLLKVIHQTGGTPRVCRSEAFEAFGGSELWKHNIAEAFRIYLKTFRHHEISQDEEQSLRKSLHIKLADPDLEKIYMDIDGDFLQLEPQKRKGCFKDALRGPLAVATLYIGQLSNYAHMTRRVIVSGGAAGNAIMRAELQKLCEEANIPAPRFTSDFSGNYGSAKIAQGAACAVDGLRLLEDLADAVPAWDPLEDSQVSCLTTDVGEQDISAKKYRVAQG